MVLDLLKKIFCDIEEGLIACSIVDVVVTFAVVIVFIIIIIYLFTYLEGGVVVLDMSLHVDDSIFFLKPEVIQPAE